MHVLFITKWYPTKENPVSGVFVKELAKAASLHDQVAVLYGYQSSMKMKSLYEISVKVEDGINVFRVKHRELMPKKLSYLLYLYSMIRTFKKIKMQFEPEVIHAHVYLAGFLGVICGKLYGIPVIITDHAEIIEESKSIAQKLMNGVRIFIARITLNRAQLLLPASDSLRKHIESFGIQNKFKIIHNVVDTEIFYPSSRERDIKTEKRMLFVGSLHPIKGISYLLNALGMLQEKRSDFHLDIVGYGPYRMEYEQLVSDLGLSNQVKFHGMKRKEEVSEFMRECDFLIFPSLILPNVWEGFGIVLIEALACGKPVITTSNCKPKEIINKDYGILIPPKDTQALLEAIEYMLNHFRDYPSEENAQYVRSRFSHEAGGNLLHETYVQVLEEYKKQ